MNEELEEKINNVKEKLSEVRLLLSDIIRNNIQFHEEKWYKQFCIIKGAIDIYLKSKDKEVQNES